MLRRLIETLIVECFEKHEASDTIKTQTGDFLYLGDLIDKMVSERTWNLGRNTRKSLAKLKDIGDKSAHSRRFNARRWDIDTEDLRVVAYASLRATWTL
jgi:hypothetical protein